MKLYKLTDQECTTRRNTVWGPGVTNSVPEDKRRPELCSDGVLHAYTNVNLALLLNPIHSYIKEPKLWIAEGDVVANDQLKVGCYELTTIEQLPLPNWYVDIDSRQRVCIQFAVLCAEAALPFFEQKFPNDKRPRQAVELAKEYLRIETSNNVSKAATYAAYAAAYASNAAAYAADAAADVADAAAYVADAATYATYAAIYAADAAAYVADAAAYVADAAAKAAAYAAIYAADAAAYVADAAAKAAAYAAADAAAKAAAYAAIYAADAAAYVADAADAADAVIDFASLADKAVALQGGCHE